MSDVCRSTFQTHRLPEIEKYILSFWKDSDILERVDAARRAAPPFVFYDGPPFATGLPHYGHILQMAIKDAVLRYKTMRGFRVSRTIGWDCHGLPVEYELEKELGLSGKRQIESFGVKKFAAAARAIVLRYASEWTGTMVRMGRWVDTDHPYTTMTDDYIESVWWALAELHRHGLVYEDYRVSPYCPRCGTVLSNFEVNLGYKDAVADPAIIVTFPLMYNGRQLDLLAWTTTPWTLPANQALAFGPDILYVIARVGEKRFVVAKDRLEAVLGEAQVEDELSGRDLVRRLTGDRRDRVYKPLFPLAGSPAYILVLGDHVVLDEGTGIVHVAPAHGEDDFKLGREHGLKPISAVEADGTLTHVGSNPELPGRGHFFKDADKAIIVSLATRGRLYRQGTIRHTYPFCWRCDTPLLYYPTTSWFVAVTKLHSRLMAENQKIGWNPSHLRDGRFGRWLDGARDWAISRDRFWGAPLPIWQCDACQRVAVVDSRAELVRLSGVVASDLHRPAIDEIRWPCSCGGQMTRVPFVFDCWFESGSMPFAQHHYPADSAALARFNPRQGIGYPADFIAEALDQTRGWFYTLHVLGVGLFDRLAFKNATVSGLLLAADGKKLSKRLRNYVEPAVLFDKHGVDALRLFLFTATALGEDYRFSDAAVAEVARRWLAPLLHAAAFYALVPTVSAGNATPELIVLDRWIKARVATVRDRVIAAMEGRAHRPGYDVVAAGRLFGPLVEDISTWYIRLSRGRADSQFGPALGEVLAATSVTFAWLLPFVTEHVFLAVDRSGQSVHEQRLERLDDWQNAAVLVEMEQVRDLVAVGRQWRTSRKIANRQPLAEAYVHDQLTAWQKSLLARELNVRRIIERSDAVVRLEFDAIISDDLAAEGEANTVRRTIQILRRQAGLTPFEAARASVSDLPPAIRARLVGQLSTTRLVDESDEPALVEATQGGRHIRLYEA